MHYVIIGFVVILGIAGFKVYSWGDDSGYNRATAENLEKDKTELIALNQENADLINQLNLQTAEHRAKKSEIEGEYKTKLSENRRKRDAAYEQYGNTIRVLLNEAEGHRKDKDRRKREAVIAHINGLPGTEGACLSPESRRDIELVSLDGDAEALLLELCLDTAKADRE